MAALFFAILATVSGAALAALVCGTLAANTIRARRGVPPVAARRRAWADVAVPVLGMIFGAALLLGALVDLRSGGAPLAGWLQVVLGCGFIAIYGALWYSRLGVPRLFRRPAPAVPVGRADPDQSVARQAAIERYLTEGNLIEAIRVYREDTGAGLAEAKAAVEALAARRPQR